MPDINAVRSALVSALSAEFNAYTSAAGATVMSPAAIVGFPSTAPNQTFGGITDLTFVVSLAVSLGDEVSAESFLADAVSGLPALIQVAGPWRGIKVVSTSRPYSVTIGQSPLMAIDANIEVQA